MVFIKSYQIIKEKKENISNAVFFAQLGLPHVLFKYIKDKEISSVESFIELFNFINLPYSLNFQSAKRGDLYSYIIGDNKHLLITLRRELLRQGIKYSSITFIIIGKIHIKIAAPKTGLKRKLNWKTFT